MRRDVMHFYNADVETVYQAYLTAAQNPPFGRTCEQKPFYSIQFGLNFSMKYNMNGGSCTIHFIPYGSGTAVNLRFSVAQLAGARFEAYDHALADQVIELLRVPAQPLQINVEEFLQPGSWKVSEEPIAPPTPPTPPVPPKPPVKDEVRSCSKCAALLLPGARFCTACGTPIPEKKVCSACGSPLIPPGVFCTVCGKKQ